MFRPQPLLASPTFRYTMETYIHIATEAFAIVGGIGAVGRWVLVKYLADQFATKQDMRELHDKVDSLDSKIDTLVARQWQRRDDRWPTKQPKPPR